LNTTEDRAHKQLHPARQGVRPRGDRQSCPRGSSCVLRQPSHPRPAPGAPAVSLESWLTSLSPVRRWGKSWRKGLSSAVGLAAGLEAGEAVSSVSIGVCPGPCKLPGLEGKQKGGSTFPCTRHPHLAEEGQRFVALYAFQIVPHYFLKLSFYLAKT